MVSKKTKILLADDEASLRQALKAILLSGDYEVITAKHGKEAVELFKRESPDMVILDVSMPYLSGFQVLDKIKKYFGEKYIPVIFLTVSVQIDHKLKALRGGAVDYLTKPISHEELLARIENFIKLKKQHDIFQQSAVYDWMTGALNKEHFLKRADEELNKAIRNKTAVSFIFMDMDHFKKINDELGHIAGDTAIKEFGRRLKKIIRNIDLIGRFGGDEFMVMLPGKGRKEAKIVAERIKKNVRKKAMVFDKKKIPISVSQGIVSMEKTKKPLDIDLNTFIGLADEALYEAKDKGGGSFIHKHIK